MSAVDDIVEKNDTKITGKEVTEVKIQNKKVSVIIPVHNSEKYIRKTLDTVLAQNYMEREIILVENQCEDNSMAVLQEYAGKYQDIRVITCEIRGAGAARNAGMEQASGEYILFVDADDYLPDNGIIEKYVKAAGQTEADIVISNYARLWDGKMLPAVKHSAFSTYSPLSEKFRFQGFFGVGTLSYVWGKLYRRSFLTHHKITFAELTYAEDKLFNMQCYICGARYLFLEDVGYIYRRNKDSISWQYHEDATKNWLKMAGIFNKWLSEQKKDGAGYENMIWYTIFFAAFFDSKMEYMQHRKSILAIRKVLKIYAQDELGQEAFQRLSDKKNVLELNQPAWQSTIRMFSFGMKMHWYMVLAAGIKILIELRMDERFSDTGIREEKNSEA